MSKFCRLQTTTLLIVAVILWKDCKLFVVPYEKNISIAIFLLYDSEVQGLEFLFFTPPPSYYLTLLVSSIRNHRPRRKYMRST